MAELKELLRDVRARFESAAIERVDAELLLAHVLGVARMQLDRKSTRLNSSHT